MPQSMLSWCFLSVSKYFSIARHLGREPDFWAENRIFKNILSSLKTCLVGVFLVFQGILAQFEIWAENHIFQPRTGFSRISQKASKHVLLMFSGCFKVFFSIVRYLSREPDFWAENQIFKKNLKKPQNMFSWCFLSVSCFLASFDNWAENRIFEPRTVFSKHFLKASKHV